MGAKVRIELNSAGIKQLLCSAEIGAECKARHNGQMFLYVGQRGEYNRLYVEVYEAENGALSGAVTQCRS